MIYILCFVVLILVNIGGGRGECTEPCQLSLIYDDLNCKPIFAEEGDCCASQYDCSHIENRPDGHCHLHGKFYEPGQSIPNSLVYRNCHISCSCTEMPEYLCATLDCPRWLGVQPNPGCYFKYKLNKCCSAGQMCPPFDDIATCAVGDEVYKEGVQFQAPDQPCVDCVCGKGFEGRFVEPFCSKRTCTAEIINSKAIRDHCAPLYRSRNDCCPFNWVCPEEADEIQYANESELKCKFGEKLLNIGDYFQRINEDEELGIDEINCKCEIPPFLTCILTLEM